MLRKTPRSSMVWLLSLAAVAVGMLFLWLALSTGPSTPIVHAQVTPTDTATPTATATPNDGCVPDVRKSDSPDPVGEGGQVTYTITVENDGDEECVDVDVTDFLPDNTECVDASVVSAPDDVDFEMSGCEEDSEIVDWDMAQTDELEEDESVTLELVVQLTSGADEGETLTNEVCVTADREADPADCDTESTDVEEPQPTATPTRAPTSTAPAPTLPPPPPPVIPTVPPPAPLPTLVPPPTGTGAATSTVVFWAAAGIATLGGLLLLGGSLMRSRRTH